MADSLKVELLYRDFNNMLRDLASIDPRVAFIEVLRYEAASVAGGAGTRTKSATEESIRKNYESRKFTSFRGKLYYLENHYPDELWREMYNARIIRLHNRFRARGLAKQSWLHVANAIGKPIRVPAYVKAANWLGRQYPQDGSASESGTGDSATLTIVNSSPLMGPVDGRKALASSMRGRVSYFQRNMAHRAFATLESRVKKYPGIFTSPVPPPAPGTPITFDVPEGMFGG